MINQLNVLTNSLYIWEIQQRLLNIKFTTIDTLIA